MKISVSLLLFAVSAIFYFKGFKELEVFNTELQSVKESFASNFHAPIPSPIQYQYSFLVSSFAGGVGVGFLLSWAIGRLKISFEPEVKAG